MPIRGSTSITVRPKPRSNLHYYFTTKSELYSAVLFDLLEVWKQDALSFETFDDPRVVLSSYIRAKMQRSRTRPYGSKVWANEIIHGASGEDPE
jgi:TetR/AcrR family transcriptional regulator